VAEGKWSRNDFTIKVDPDCVFIPELLAPRLAGYGTWLGEKLYVLNSGKVFGFLGPLEIVSQYAARAMAIEFLLIAWLLN